MRFLKHLPAILLTALPHLLAAQHKDIPPTDRFSISGAVKQPMEWTATALAGMPQDTLSIADSHDGSRHMMRGVLLKTLLDSAHVHTTDHKAYSQLCIVLTASDGYKNIYSWNELFNTPVGDRIYVITEMDGHTISNLKGRILVVSAADKNTNRRNLKSLSEIEVKMVE